MLDKFLERRKSPRITCEVKREKQCDGGKKERKEKKSLASVVNPDWSVYVPL
jgi:hypothetical protein